MQSVISVEKRFSTKHPLLSFWRPVALQPKWCYNLEIAMLTFNWLNATMKTMDVSSFKYFISHSLYCGFITVLVSKHTATSFFVILIRLTKCHIYIILRQKHPRNVCLMTELAEELCSVDDVSRKRYLCWYCQNVNQCEALSYH